MHQERPKNELSARPRAVPGKAGASFAARRTLHFALQRRQRILSLASRHGMPRQADRHKTNELGLTEGGVQMEGKDLEAIYRIMLRIRRFDEGVMDLFKEGLVKGTAHSYVGQEAVAAGACAALTKDGLRRQPSPRPRPLHRQGRLAREDDGRADGTGHRLLQGPGRLDAHRRSRAQHPRRQRDRRRGHRHRHRRGAVATSCAATARSAWCSSATARPTKASSTSASTSARCGSCRWCTCARTTSTRCPPR